MKGFFNKMEGKFSGHQFKAFLFATFFVPGTTYLVKRHNDQSLKEKEEELAFKQKMEKFVDKYEEKIISNEELSKSYKLLDKQSIQYTKLLECLNDPNILNEDCLNNAELYIQISGKDSKITD